MDCQINASTSEYLSRFYEPKVTAYEFLKCFFAYLKKERIDQINRDLVSFLYKQKQNNSNDDVLEEIKFRNNGVKHYSDDVEDALFNLQNGGLLGKMNPSFGIIIINYTDSEITETLNSIPSKYRAIISNIATEYINN